MSEPVPTKLVEIRHFAKLQTLIREQAKWSQATFGSDLDRGPIGALKHLAKEVNETLEKPRDRTEYADCFLLVIDAARRAGITFGDLVEASADKLEVCKQRQWGTPNGDEPVEHVRES